MPQGGNGGGQQRLSRANGGEVKSGWLVGQSAGTSSVAAVVIDSRREEGERCSGLGSGSGSGSGSDW